MSTERKPKRLLFYLPGLVDGGAERVMADLAGSFAAAGDEVVLAVDFRADDNSPPLAPGIRFRPLDGNHLVSLVRLARLIRTERPDIVISAIASASFKLVLADLIARAAGSLVRRRQRPPKLVLTYHGFDEHQTGWLSYLGFVTLPLIGRYATSVVAVSDALRDNLAGQWRASRANLVRIYCPVTTPAMPEGFDPLDLSRRENLVLSVGRLVGPKRFDRLIEAFAGLADHSARLVILGDGPERERLERLVGELGLAQRVSLPGYTRDTGAYFARARCFALVSEKESFGLVYVEALSFGLPVIATAEGGPREVLDDGRYGLLLHQPSVEALREALEQQLANPGDPRPRLQRAALFSRASGTAQYRQLFDRLLQDERAPHQPDRTG
jgi:glycosyltransferase involved in cell wall biosynthesis